MSAIVTARRLPRIDRQTTRHVPGPIVVSHGGYIGSQLQPVIDRNNGRIQIDSRRSCGPCLRSAREDNMKIQRCDHPAERKNLLRAPQVWNLLRIAAILLSEVNDPASREQSGSYQTASDRVRTWRGTICVTKESARKVNGREVRYSSPGDGR